MIVYAVEHREDGKLYIGWSSRTLERRRNDHVYNAFKRQSRTRFHNALRKHGVDTFDWWTLEMHDTVDQAKLAEMSWISYLKAQGVELYNTTDGGDHHNGFLGKKHSPETRQKMTEKRTGRKLKFVRRGEAAGHRKLTQQQVNEIRASTLTLRELSKIYGVVESQICHIKKGRNWL